VLISGEDHRLDGNQIRAAVPEWRSASIWFCGPPQFGETLRADFLANGLAADDFHQELFQLR
jgi:predicted ferric reductase